MSGVLVASKSSVLERSEPSGELPLKTWTVKGLPAASLLVRPRLLWRCRLRFPKLRAEAEKSKVRNAARVYMVKVGSGGLL